MSRLSQRSKPWCTEPIFVAAATLRRLTAQILEQRPRRFSLARKRAQEEKQREQHGRQRLLTAASAAFALLAEVASAAGSVIGVALYLHRF